MKISHLIRLLMVFYCLPGSSGLSTAQVIVWEKQLDSAPDSTYLLLNLGRYYHDIGGMRENKEAVKKAEKYLIHLLEIEPENSLGLVYYGSVLTLKVRDTRLPWNQLKYIKEGMAKMDMAVSIDPEQAEIRLIRGINSTSMPRMFNRLLIALEDFRYIERLHQKNELKKTSRFWLPYYYNYGLALSQNKDFETATIQFLKTIETDPHSSYAKDAEKELKKIEEISDGR